MKTQNTWIPHSLLKGILSSFIIGSGVYLLSPHLPLSNSILLGFIVGILLANLIKIPADFEPGITFTSGKLLELSLLFLAFSINYQNIRSLGLNSFFLLAITIILVLLLTLYLAKKFNCPGSTGWLVGFGTAICGSSAIAALAPFVSKSKEDTGIALAVVNIMGSLAMLILPLLIPIFGYSPEEMGILIGGSLHSVGNVAGAGYALSDQIGETSITIKLARVAMLSPSLILFNYLVNSKSKKSWKEYLQLPWYLYGFVGISIVVSLLPIPVALIATMETLGKYILTIAMTAIGMKISISKLLLSGKKGILFGILLFVIQLSLLLVFIHLF